MENLKESSAICGLCPHGCWVKASVSEGKLIAVAPEHDSRYGNLCRRGKLAPKIIYSPDRIRTPLIRNGRKGELAFREATWDEALDTIVSGFIRIRETYGAKAVASYMGAGTLEDGLSDNFRNFLEPFGSPNDMDCGSVCYVSSRIMAPLTTVGIQGENISCDFENAKLIILWGANPFKEGLPDKMRQIQQARSRGASMIVVDPRQHSLTRDADRWISVTPGTDGALILAIINYIIRHGWFDREFVGNWSVGFDELADYASKFTPEATAWICGVDPGTIEWLASLIAKTSGVAVDFYSGLEYAPSGVQNTRAMYSLLALTGNLDVEGGLYIHQYPHAEFSEHSFESKNPPLGRREYPLFHALTGRAHIAGLASAVLRDDPYPVRGLLIAGGSPYRSYPDPMMWKRIYESLDFMAVIDRFMPEEASWADVVLPAATYYEIDSYHLYKHHIRLRRKMIEPVGQAMNDSLILAALAKRLGYGSAFPQNEEETIRRGFEKIFGLELPPAGFPEILALPLPQHRPEKYKSGHLRKDGRPGFPTPSGKFEFASTLLKRHGYDALPVYRDPRAFSFATDSLMLTTGARSRSRFNSQYLDRPELAEQNLAVAEINPIDAERRNILSGDSVRLRTNTGEILLEAHVTPDISAGTLHVPFGGGGRRQIGLWPGAAINAIIPPELKDPISGYPILKAVVCEVTLAEKKSTYVAQSGRESIISQTFRPDDASSSSSSFILSS